MLRVLTCLATEHDWRLVLLAGVICLFASIVVVSLYLRARAGEGRVRRGWLALAAASAGCGIWATHFIAMLAYQPGISVGYDVLWTGVSLAIAGAASWLALRISLSVPGIRGSLAAGIVAGAGIAAMHYTGMAALEIPGHLAWSWAPAAASVLLGMAFSAAAFAIMSRCEGTKCILAAAAMLALGIVSLHFTAMTAVVIVPDASVVQETTTASPQALAFAVAAAALAILGMALIAALFDRRSEVRIRQQKLRLDAALENMSQGLCMFDAGGRVMVFNTRYAQMAGMPAETLHGRSLLEVIGKQPGFVRAGGKAAATFEDILRDMREGRPRTVTFEAANGRVMRVVDQPMAGGGGVATYEDVTDIREAEAKIIHMARHDVLTGLPNRAYFCEQLELALRRVKRREQLAVFFLDLDHFKEVNDTFGHPVGDKLLKAVAARLKDCVREVDIVARFGGDEFAVAELSTQGREGSAEALARRLIEVISAPYCIDGRNVEVGTSIGISLAPDDSAELDQLLKNADLALYRVKVEGRGTYRFFEAAMNARAQLRRAIERDLRDALAGDGFELHYQPIHAIETNAIAGFEALARWNHPERGMVPPGVFIPVAEETGLIVPIGARLLRKACDEAAGWPRAVRVAVNLSPSQFKGDGLVDVIAGALAASGLAPERLELEITESVLLQENEGTLETLRRLRGLGIRISMDDFGTGYSSLSYLRKFPFDKIKVDQSFVRELPNSEDSRAIVRAVTGLGKSLGIATVAEGVETAEQLAMLKAEGCTEAQGYLFSRPVPALEVARLLADEGARPHRPLALAAT